MTRKTRRYNRMVCGALAAAALSATPLTGGIAAAQSRAAAAPGAAAAVQHPGPSGNESAHPSNGQRGRHASGVLSWLLRPSDARRTPGVTPSASSPRPTTAVTTPRPSTSRPSTTRPSTSSPTAPTPTRTAGTPTPTYGSPTPIITEHPAAKHTTGSATQAPTPERATDSVTPGARAEASAARNSTGSAETKATRKLAESSTGPTTRGKTDPSTPGAGDALLEPSTRDDAKSGAIDEPLAGGPVGNLPLEAMDMGLPSSGRIPTGLPPEAPSAKHLDSQLTNAGADSDTSVTLLAGGLSLAALSAGTLVFIRRSRRNGAPSQN